MKERNRNVKERMRSGKNCERVAQNVWERMIRVQVSSNLWEGCTERIGTYDLSTHFSGTA